MDELTISNSAESMEGYITRPVIGTTWNVTTIAAVEGEIREYLGNPPLLSDTFATNEAAPIVSPRPCEPGPGSLVTTDTENKISIANQELVLDAPKASAAWEDPAWYGRDDSDQAFVRGRVFEADIQFTALGFIAIGWNTSTTLALANCENSFFLHSNRSLSIRNTMDDADEAVAEYLGVLDTGIQYSIAIETLLPNGAVHYIKGGYYGDVERPIAIAAAKTSTPVYPAVLDNSAKLTMDNVKVTSAKALALYPCFFNGSTDFANDYKIGGGVALINGLTGRQVENPILVGSQAWEDQVLKDPWVLKDGATWTVWYRGGRNVPQIGRATSMDRVNWTKDAGNPVLSLGGGGSWDDTRIEFPTVLKDPGDADAGRRYKMWYQGTNAAGTQAVGYAYSADGISWTKSPSNPVFSPGVGWDSAAVLAGGILKSGATYYLFYGGRSTTAFPNQWQTGIVSFTDPEGTYTRENSGNPIVANNMTEQTLTGTTASGSTTVTVADTSGFSVDDLVVLTDGTERMVNQIASITNSTTLELLIPVWTDFTTATEIQHAYRAVTPRGVWEDSGTYYLSLTPFQTGKTGPDVEVSGIATASSILGPWTVVPGSPLWLPSLGRNQGWDAYSCENLMLALDADTNQPVNIRG
jgi:hypothetical protein